MARKSNKDFKPAIFETNDTNFAHSRIYVSMLESVAWGNLTNNARVLYLYMKSQFYRKDCIEGFSSKEYFYFNQGMWQGKYNLYKNKNQFYKDRDLLIANGFIEIAVQGRNTRTKMVYKFSDQWKYIT